MITSPEFYPNDLVIEDIDNLVDWQLFVAAIHYADSMKDCRDLNYSYEWKTGYGISYSDTGQPYITYEGIWKDSIMLKGDLELDNIQNGFRYFGKRGINDTL